LFVPVYTGSYHGTLIIPNWTTAIPAVSRFSFLVERPPPIKPPIKRAPANPALQGELETPNDHRGEEHKKGMKLEHFFNRFQLLLHPYDQYNFDEKSRLPLIQESKRVELLKYEIKNRNCFDF